MIAFDLMCSEGHRFEGWFDSIESFEKQKQQKLVACPHCDGTDITRIPSAVSVKRSSGESGDRQSPGCIDYSRLAKEIVNYVQKNFEDVGTKFASEALKMHYGVKEKRNIRGTATSEEEKILKEEGIEFFKAPIPKSHQDDD